MTLVDGFRLGGASFCALQFHVFHNRCKNLVHRFKTLAQPFKLLFRARREISGPEFLIRR
jgi:hypothetical protein